MKTYQNEKHGFEIDIPENWSPPPAIAYKIAGILSGPMPRGLQKDVFQYGCAEEAFNFEIAPLFPEPLLEDTDREFQLFARDRGYSNLVLGRITVAGKEHVCASYFINDNMGKRWNKKYMLVFGGMEFAITATCNDPQFFVAREKDWDAIIQTFYPLRHYDQSPGTTNRDERYLQQRRDVTEKRIEMRDTLGDLYARGYDAVSVGDYRKAQQLLEQCLQENPNHVLAHKELAIVLEKRGNFMEALHHRMEVKRLAPGDIVNNAKLDQLLARSGRTTEAMRNVQAMRKETPGHPVHRDVERKLKQSSPPNYRTMFLSSLICMLLIDITFFFPENFAIRNAGCMSLLMLMPTWGIWVSGPWVGIPKMLSAILALGLYVFFLIHVW